MGTNRISILRTTGQDVEIQAAAVRQRRAEISRAGAAAELAAHHVTQRTAQPAADRRATVAGSQRALGDQDAHDQSRECQTHDEVFRV